MHVLKGYERLCFFGAKHGRGVLFWRLANSQRKSRKAPVVSRSEVFCGFLHRQTGRVHQTNTGGSHGSHVTKMSRTRNEQINRGKKNRQSQWKNYSLFPTISLFTICKSLKARCDMESMEPKHERWKVLEGVRIESSTSGDSRLEEHLENPVSIFSSFDR